LKKDLPPNSQNVEVSRDLAALSISGGVLVVGVRDGGMQKAGEVVGVEDPQSRLTRLVDLANAVVQPSLVCDASVLEDPDDNERGCVICVIPPSAVAPHRVDDRYWGRSAEGKRVLSDPEVADLFAKRRHRDDDFLEQLLGLAGDFDPLPVTSRGHGHFYLAATPMQPSLATSPPWDHTEHPLFLINRAGMPRHGSGWPDLASLQFSPAHPSGILATSYSSDDAERDEEYLLKLLVRDDGAAHFVSGAGTVTYDRGSTGGPVTCVPLTMQLVLADFAVVFFANATRVTGRLSFVRVVAQIATGIGLACGWRLGARVTGTLGAVTLDSLSVMRLSRAARYAESEFVRIVDVAPSRLNAPPSVVEDLMGPLARGLGEQKRLFPYEDPSELFRR
jgi:hypothetical protein